MPIDLIAGTDAALCAVYDPASVSRLRLFTWDKLLAGMLDKEAEAGRLVLLDTGADGTFKLRAYVDEPPPPELVARAFHHEQGKLLRVPSGTLHSAGAEYLVDEKQAAPELSTTATIPPGDYRVDAYLIDHDENDTRGLPIDRLTGVAVLATIATLPIALLFLSTNDWVFQPVSLTIVVALVTAWLPLLIWHQLPSTRDARRRLADSITPSLVLALERLPDGTDVTAMKGVLLRPPGDAP